MLRVEPVSILKKYFDLELLLKWKLLEFATPDRSAVQLRNELAIRDEGRGLC